MVSGKQLIHSRIVWAESKVARIRWPSSSDLVISYRYNKEKPIGMLLDLFLLVIQREMSLTCRPTLCSKAKPVHFIRILKAKSSLIYSWVCS